MPNIREGQKAPNFKLQDKDGKPHQPSAPGAEYTVLYFYPKDSTPGCTIEAQEFSSWLKEFSARKARVLGVSGGDNSSKAKFCSKYKLTVSLLSDTDFKVARSYGAFGDKKFMGRSFKGIFRKTFLLDKKGTIVKVFDSVKPEGHALEVLAAIDSLTKKGAKPAIKSASAARKKVAKKAATKKKAAAPKKAAARRKAAPAKPKARKASKKK